MYGKLDETLNEIRDRYSLVEIVERYHPGQFRRKGGRYAMLCPFHSEKTASFFVDNEKGLFYCFGCGTGGDTITFVMEYEHLSFIEAIKDMCEKFDIPFRAGFREERKMEKKASIIDLNKEAANLFHNRLLSHDSSAEEAREYLYDRGITDEVIQRWQLGYARDSWDDLLNHFEMEHDKIQLHKAGLIIEKGDQHGQYYDRFRKRIIFPIKDKNKKTIGFGGRTLFEEEDIKYLNTPETEVYNKSKVLFGIDKANQEIRESREAIIMEGYFDVITAHEKGITNAIATCGTAVTEEHLEILSLKAKKIMICYDADDAGLRAAQKAGMNSLSLGIPIHIVSLPYQDKDPDDILREPDGYETFLNSKDKSQSLLEFMMDVKGLKSINNPDEAYSVVKSELFEIISTSKNPTHKALWLKQIANTLGIDQRNLTNHYRLYLDSLKPKKEVSQIKEIEIEDYLLGFLAKKPAYRSLASKMFSRDDFSTPIKSLFFDFLCSTSLEDGLTIRRRTHVPEAPLFQELGRTNLIKEFKEYYQMNNPDTNEKESVFVLHEEQLGELEAILRQTSDADKSSLELMEMKKLREELGDMQSEILSSAQKQGPKAIDFESVEEYRKKLGKYENLAFRYGDRWEKSHQTKR